MRNRDVKMSITSRFLVAAGLASALTFAPVGLVNDPAFARGHSNTGSASEAEGARPPSAVVDVPGYFDVMSTNSNEPLGMIFVLAIDISGSINSGNNEYATQIEAFADAMRRDDFREAIFAPGGPGSIGVFVVDYATNSKLQIGGVDFRQNDRNRFREFADRIEAIERRGSGGTYHHSALENAEIIFHLARERGWANSDTDMLVNIMTDGTGNADHNRYYTERLAEEFGATVTSMVIRASDRIYPWCRDFLTTPGNTYRGPDGEPVPSGQTREVATEQDTRGEGASRYRDRTYLMMRRQVTSRTAWLDLDMDTGTDFADAGPLTPRGLFIAR